MSYARNMQIKHIIYECLRLSECSHNLRRYFFLYLYLFVLYSFYSFLNWHGWRHAPYPLKTIANCGQWVRKLGSSWWCGGGSGYGETGTINRLFKRAAAEGSFLKQQQIEYISAKQREMQMSMSFKPHLGGSYTLPVVPPWFGAALPTWLSVCPSEELPALLLPPQECEESFVMLAA